MHHQGSSMPYHCVFQTAFGYCGIVWSDRGVCHFLLPMVTPGAVRDDLTRRHPASDEREPSALVEAIILSTQRYFAGEREDFSSIPIDLHASPFQRAIYDATRQLRYGETTTYGALADAAGFPKAARETGSALGHNPIPLIVPCHRVLAAGGKLGGFSAPGGKTTKQKMLLLEGASPPNGPPGQGRLPF